VTVYDFKDNNNQYAKSSAFGSEVTTLQFNTINEVLFCGTLGGTIHMWNFQQNKMVSKMNGHLS